MFTITIDIADVVRNLDLSKKRLMDNTSKAMDRIVKEGQKIMIQEAPKGTGRLKKSIKTKVERSSKQVVGTIDPTARYADAVETGRPAGGRPPIESIRRWVAAKGLSEGIAFAIAKKIGEGKSGSNRPNPFAERTFNEVKDIVEDELEKAISQTVGAFK